MTSARVNDTIFEALAPSLLQLGFRKRAGAVFTLDFTPDVVGWLGLNRATRDRAPGEVEINPVVGVRFQSVERLVAECRKEKFHSYQPPTISSPLGYVMPQKQYKAWLFSRGHGGAATIDIINAIAWHGIAFMRSATNLAELRRCMEEHLGLEHQLVYRRPAAAMLAGDLIKARTLLDEMSAAVRARTDLAATDLKKFAEAMLDRLRRLPDSDQ
jgi:hypothetical protein